MVRTKPVWANWRGIADLSLTGAYGQAYGSVASVPGREYSALAKVPGAAQPHRVLVQVPDAFDLKGRCVVVTAASGSRGVYGAIAVAGAWGLPKGCAVAHTDKGAGTDYFDLDSGQGVRLDGTVGPAADNLAFKPEAPAGASGIAFKHAHSGDNPEADWGRHVKQAAEFLASGRFTWNGGVFVWSARTIDALLAAHAPAHPSRFRLHGTSLPASITPIRSRSAMLNRCSIGPGRQR